MSTWLTATEGAKYARVHVCTIRQAVMDGDLPAYPVGKSGRAYRVTAEEIDKWLKSRSYEPPSERGA